MTNPLPESDATIWESKCREVVRQKLKLQTMVIQLSNHIKQAEGRGGSNWAYRGEELVVEANRLLEEVQ